MESEVDLLKSSPAFKETDADVHAGMLLDAEMQRDCEKEAA